MAGLSSSNALVDRLATSKDQQTALQFAFYNALVFVLTGLCLCGIYALYKMMYMFLSPILWAVLVGTVLFPFKKQITEKVQRWLRSLRDNNQTLAEGLVTTPFYRFRDFADYIYRTAMSRTGLHAVIAYIVLKMLTYERTFVYIINLAGYLYNFIDGFVSFFSRTWLFPIMLIYFCAYAAWIYVQTPGTVNKKVARVISLPIWTYVLCFLSSYFGPLRAAVFGASAAVLGALSAGLWKADKSADGTSPEHEDEVKLLHEEEWPELPPKEGKEADADTASVVSIDKAIKGDKLISITGGLCALSWLVRHDSALMLVLVPFLFAAIRRAGANSGFTPAVYDALKSFWERVRPHAKRIVDITVAGPLRQFVKVLFSSDKMVVESLHSNMDMLSSVAVMALLGLSALSALTFVGFQLHNETTHLAQLATNVVQSRPDWLGAAMNYTEDKLEDHQIDINDYMKQAYEHGRSWLASNVRALANPKDSERADMLETQVKKIVDKLYGMWEQRNIAPAVEKAAEVRPDWKSQLMQVTDVHALKEELTHIKCFSARAILDPLNPLDPLDPLHYWPIHRADSEVMKRIKWTTASPLVARSGWSLLSGNLSLVASLLGSLGGLILDFGTDIINLVIETIVFLTVVYYLLSASRDRWLPIEWASNLPHLLQTSESPATTSATGSLHTEPSSKLSDHEVTGAIEQAISGVFVLSSKMALFYGLYTYFLHTLFDLNVVFVPSMLAALFAAIPLMPPYIVCIFGVIELWLVRGELASAIVFAVLSFAPRLFADTAFYKEVKFSHPYLTGLSIIGGMYWLGLQGAIIGPIILCTFLVFLHVFTNYAGTRGEKLKTR